MKKLYLIRHAKSSWDDLSLSDFDRPLNERGKKDAPRMAKRLKEKRVVPDVVLTSSANRAFATCLEFCKILHFEKNQIHIEKKLYHANEDQILDVVRTIKDRKSDEEEIVLLFGHNPGLTEFANALIDEAIDNIPTSGIVICNLSVTSWKDVRWACGKLESFDFPKNQED